MLRVTSRPPLAAAVVLLVHVAAGSALAQKPAATAASPAPPTLDRDTAMWLVTLPLACVDKPHDPPRSRGYLYESTAVIKADYMKTRAFYGCSDWHSAVNSTWTMVKIAKLFPQLPVAHLIREKLKEHITEDTIKGEIAFYSEEGNKAFERPYGWAWLLRLHAELRTWDDPEAQKWAANLEPLAKLLLERTVPYLKSLAAPMRVGTHANTAYTLRLLLEYARANNEKSLENATIERAQQFFTNDAGCAPNVEVSGSDFFSPCLSEASLMGSVMPPAEFARWLDAFLPGPDSPGFRGVAEIVTMEGSAEDLKKSDMLGAKAHLIGLGVSRARALEDIANSLPPGDRRIAPYRKLGVTLANASIKTMYEAAYAGTHWIGTYILDYLVSVHRQTNAPPAVRR